MELKKYQKRVIADLMDYLDQLNEQSSLGRAFSAYWESRQIPVGQDGIQGYQNCCAVVSSNTVVSIE